MELPEESGETVAAEAVGPPSGAEARALVESVPLWYHVLELGPDLVTPGWFDLRPIVELLPWPDVRGKRCLDVGPWDGFLSFELERRGAAEVVAVDIGDVAEWDWPLRNRRSGPLAVSGGGETTTGRGFEVAKRLLDSKVERRVLSVYELGPDAVGTFDVVVCGSLLLHLKNPIGALEAIRSVCTEAFLSAEQIDPILAIAHRRAPAARQRGGEKGQWWIPNPRGHAEMVAAAGFEIERTTRPYAIPLAPGHADARPGRLRRRLGLLPGRLLTRGPGMPHAALLARPGKVEE